MSIGLNKIKTTLNSKKTLFGSLCLFIALDVLVNTNTVDKHSILQDSIAALGWLCLLIFLVSLIIRFVNKKHLVIKIIILAIILVGIAFLVRFEISNRNNNYSGATAEMNMLIKRINFDSTVIKYGSGCNEQNFNEGNSNCYVDAYVFRGGVDTKFSSEQSLETDINNAGFGSSGVYPPSDKMPVAQYYTYDGQTNNQTAIPSDIKALKPYPFGYVITVFY